MGVEPEVDLLIVEDNPGDVAHVEELLDELPNARFRIDVVDRLKTALQHLEDGSSYDCLLVDLSLPDAEGAEIVNELRRAAPNASIVVLTGLNDVQTGIETARLGADDYLIKRDVRSDALERTIRNS